LVYAESATLLGAVADLVVEFRVVIEEAILGDFEYLTKST
jgi:hypothetical protein